MPAGPSARCSTPSVAARGSRATSALSTSHGIAIPIALPDREICLPARAVADLEGPEKQAMLAHELAHVVRRDPGFTLLSQLLQALFFFQPLHRLAHRRWQEASECLCDDWAVKNTGEPLQLASCLAGVASWMTGRALPVPAMAREGSHLGRRIRRLIAGRTVSREPRWLLVALSGLLVVVTFGAPAVTFDGSDAPAAPEAPKARAHGRATAPAPAELPELPTPPETPEAAGDAALPETPLPPDFAIAVAPEAPVAWDVDAPDPGDIETPEPPEVPEAPMAMARDMARRHPELAKELEQAAEEVRRSQRELRDAQLRYREVMKKHQIEEEKRQLEEAKQSLIEEKKRLQDERAEIEREIERLRTEAAAQK
ncbi:MAG: M56 family metallopeptidase [Acidobacteriota bacterium]